VNSPEKEINNIQDLFKRLKISEDALSLEQKKFLEKNGYLKIPPTNYLKKNLKLLNDITSQLILNEGHKGGWEGKEKYYKKDRPFEPVEAGSLKMGAERLGNLIEKNKIFGDLILLPEILLGAYEVIKSDFKISGLNLRNPLKDFGEQAYHIDWLPRKNKEENFSGVVCYIFLEEATIENGATRIIPGTHKNLGWPDEHIDTSVKHKDEIRVVVPAGTIVIMNLNTWHAGAKNIDGKSRKTIFLQIKRRDEPQLLNYKKYLSEKTKKNLNDSQRYLLAIRDKDFTQKEDSVGPGDVYRKIYGKDRGAISRK
tara:strand:- start:280 stop:1212 length:933 start_codon:yes stop_codon:yes gene_type:complete